jgi:hypothetical protein
LHGKPGPLTQSHLALVSLEIGQKDKAQVHLKQARPAKEAPWEEVAGRGCRRTGEARGKGQIADDEAIFAGWWSLVVFMPILGPPATR